MIYWTYFLAVFEDPGFVEQDDYDVENSFNVGEIKEQTKKAKQFIREKRK